MKRVILDTNIYEFMLKEIDAETLQKISSQKEMIIRDCIENCCL